jgi:hypothetical protein
VRERREERDAVRCVWAEKVEEKGRKGCLADVERFAMCCLWTEKVREREGKKGMSCVVCGLRRWKRKEERGA